MSVLRAPSTKVCPIEQQGLRLMFDHDELSPIVQKEESRSGSQTGSVINQVADVSSRHAAAHGDRN